MDHVKWKSYLVFGLISVASEQYIRTYLQQLNYSWREKFIQNFDRKPESKRRVSMTWEKMGAQYWNGS
jgi:hypothetical protein